MAKRDIVSGLLLLLFGIYTGSTALTYGYMSEYGPGAGFYPFWVAVMLCILSIVLIVRGWIDVRKGNNKLDPSLKMLVRPMTLAIALGILFAVALFLEKIGFVITVGLSAAFYSKTVKIDYPWLNAIAFGMVSSLVIYVAFRYVLGINLPRGVLPL